MAKPKKVYFIGIGGIGMSALARWFLALNRAEGLAQNRAGKRAEKWAVSGSDLTPSRITRELQKEGAEVNFGHKKGHLRADLGSTLQSNSGQAGSPQVTLIIRSQAIKADNPELREAARLGMPTIAYPEAVGVLTESHKTIAISGAHGKSTTTALAGLILKRAGLDPTIIVGTELKELDNKNFRLGKSEYLVLEADEFGRAFLNYSPTIAVVTNIDKEHLDTYKDLAGVKKTFLEFLARTRAGGTLILNKDNAALASLAKRITKIAKENRLRILWYSVRGNTAKKIKKVIKIPGLHNISNAVAAYKVGRVLGVSHKTILAAISRYRGSWRRFEYRGLLHVSRYVLHVYDDYAHHPTEIKATLQAFREKFPKSQIVCVFQPHQTERLRLLFKEFTTAFSGADVIVIIPTYKVTGRESVGRRASGIKLPEELAAAIQKKYPAKPVFYLANPKKLKSFIKKTLLAKPHTLNPKPHALSPTVLVMMGAGDVVNYTDSLLGAKQKGPIT